MKDYFVRQSNHINDDLKRGWSSWNYGKLGIHATADEIKQMKRDAIENGDSFDISGFELWGDEIKNADMRELYANYWVLVDRSHGSGIAVNSLKAKNLKDAIAELETHEMDLGDGEWIDADELDVVYSDGNLHILERDWLKPKNKKLEKGGKVKSMNFFYSYETSPGKFSMNVVDAAGKIIWQSIHPAFITDSLTGQLIPDETPMELGIMKNLDDVAGLERHLKNSMLLSQDDKLIIADVFTKGGSLDFYINENGNFIKAENAKKVNGINANGEFFVVKRDNGRYTIYDFKSGFPIDANSFNKTIKDAVDNANNLINRSSVPLDKMLESIIQKYGISPGYGNEKKESIPQAKSILNSKTDLLGSEKDEHMIPIKRDRYLDNLKPDDVVIVKRKNGLPDAEMSFRGYHTDGKAIVYSRQDGQFAVDKDAITPKNSKVVEGSIGSIEYALENNLYQENIADGRMSAADAKAIIESAGLEVPEDIIQMTDKFSDGGEIGESPKRKGNSYMDRVLENMEFMKSNLSDWAAVPIKGKEKTMSDKGEDVEMPVFDFPKGYTSAVSLFPMSSTGTHNCELCGKTPIKTVYWIQNDKEKKTLRVGSECVRYVGEGLSGKENLRKAKVEMAKILDNDLGRLASLLYKKYTRVEDRGYGRKERVWKTSFVGDGGTSEFWVNLKNRMASLNPTELFDSKKLNRSNKDTLYWSYVYKKIPYFGWESELKHMSQSGASEVSIESKLLSWFTKNEKLGVTMIKQVIETLEIIGSYEKGEYNSDYLDAYDTNLVDKPEFEEGGEIPENSIPKDEMGYTISWLLNETQMWSLAKNKGSELVVLTKTGKSKRVKVKESGISGHRYLTFDGAEYLSIMEEWKYNIIPRALKYGLFKEAIANKVITEEQGTQIVNSAYFEKGGKLSTLTSDEKIYEMVRLLQSIQSELENEIKPIEFGDYLRREYSRILQNDGEEKANQLLDASLKKVKDQVKDANKKILKRLKDEYFKKHNFAPSSIRDFENGIKSAEYKVSDLPSYRDAMSAGVIKEQLDKGGKMLDDENMLSKIPLKKNCRVDYANKYSFLVDYTDGNDSIIYYESGVKPLDQLYSDFKFSVKNELPIDNFDLSFFPYPFKKVKGAVYQYVKGGKLTPAKKEKLIKAVAEQYQGKKVKPKYQEKYGKRYSKKEAKSVAYAIANTVENMKNATKAPAKKNKYNNLLPGF